MRLLIYGERAAAQTSAAARSHLYPAPAGVGHAIYTVYIGLYGLYWFIKVYNLSHAQNRAEEGQKYGANTSFRLSDTRNAVLP